MLMLSQLDADILPLDTAKMWMKLIPIMSTVTATIMIHSLSLKMVREKSSKVKQAFLRILSPIKEDMSKMIVTMVLLVHLSMDYMITLMLMFKNIMVLIE
mgnify:CR=1 FL=1